MKKVFLLLEMGKPFGWTQKFIDHVQFLGEYGWYFKLFTPNSYHGNETVEVVPMSLEQLNDTIAKKTNLRPKTFITDKGIPSLHITDYYVTLGKILEDYTKGFDFWGSTGLDDVFGRLDHFFPDSLLSDCDVYSDDVGHINGNFCLWRNEERMNTLFQQIPNWTYIFTQENCPACLGMGKDHLLIGTDEFIMEKNMPHFMKQGIRYKTPKYFSPHSYDRLSIHLPHPQLEITDDHSLWERIYDMYPIIWQNNQKGYMAREIPYFHFSTIKQWPI